MGEHQGYPDTNGSLFVICLRMQSQHTYLYISLLYFLPYFLFTTII